MKINSVKLMFGVTAPASRESESYSLQKASQMHYIAIGSLLSVDRKYIAIPFIVADIYLIITDTCYPINVMQRYTVRPLP